ncbi:MAG: FAD-dependent oxidoreductase [Alphaproteobacteria bacterium]|nr:FAD-dependent oxidoreductase [Alphaproteobacteria bacterium]
MHNGLDHLFQPLSLRGKTLKNRIFSTGHMAVMLDDGKPSKRMAAYHGAKAQGGAALTIIEAARVHPSGDSGRPAIRAYDKACIPGYAHLAEACQPHGCLVFAQLTHPGREMTLAADGTHPVAYAPSAIPNERFHVMPRQISLRLIDDIIEGFAISSAHIREAGLDGIELVASHGYLLGQFLNPNVNRRNDAYGGNKKKRLQFLLDAIAATRHGAGENMIIGVRLSGEEKDHDGLALDEMLEICTVLDGNSNLDYFNVTVGTSAGLAGSTHIVPPMAYEAAYTLPIAAAIKSRVSKPIFVAGRINQPQLAEQAIKSGQADMCGMTRALISDPQMPAKAQRGDLDDIRACVACNQACIGHMLNAYAISCIQHPETGRELEFGQLTSATTRQRVLVVGGGPAGMKASSIAAMRGHQVVLYDANPVLGGQVNLAQLLPGRAEFGGVITNLKRECEQSGVTIHLNTRVTTTLIEEGNPDIVIIDSADDMVPMTGFTSDTSLDGDRVYRGLMRLSSKNNVVLWTTAQGNREALSADVVDLHMVGRSIGKVQRAAVVLALCQNEDEAAFTPPRGRIYIAKNRFGRKKRTYPVVYDWAFQRIVSLMGDY